MLEYSNNPVIIEERRQHRQNMVVRKRELRRAFRVIAKEYNVSYFKLLSLYSPSIFTSMHQKNDYIFSHAELYAILDLFGKGIRSKFKKDMRNQFIAWLRDDSKKYSMPFSKRQFECIGKRNFNDLDTPFNF